MKNIGRRHLTVQSAAIGLAGVSLLQPGATQAASSDDEAVMTRLKAFRDAQFARDASALAALVADELSYSHSDAHIEDKATFIKNATSGNSKLLSLEYKDPWVRVVRDAAIVRFHWIAESETIPAGKKSKTNLHILMVWQKQDGDWKLLARGSTKL
jgi:ketosteroid isomerase-like protein